MAVNLSFIGGAGWQFFDDSGNPLSGGKIYTYASGTTTPQATYTSRTGLTPNTNPIILDAAGRTPEEVWSTEGLLYKYVVADSNDVVIRTWDGIGGSVVASDLAVDLANTTDNAKGDALIGFKQSNASGFLTGAVAGTVNKKLQEIVSPEDFGAIGDGSADDYNAFAALYAYANAKGSNITIRFGSNKTYYLNKYRTATNGVNYLLLVNINNLIVDFNGSTLKIKGDFTRTANSDVSLSGIWLSACSNAVVCNGKIDGGNQFTSAVGGLSEGSAGSSGIVLSGGSNIYIANMIVSNAECDGIYFTGSGNFPGPYGNIDNVVVSNCTFQNSGRNNCSVTMGNYITFIACQFLYAGFTAVGQTSGPYPGYSPKAGVDIEPDVNDPNVIAGGLQYLIFDKCVFRGNGNYQFIVAPKNYNHLTIRDCVVDARSANGTNYNNAQYNFYPATHKAKIYNTIIYGNVNSPNVPSTTVPSEMEFDGCTFYATNTVSPAINYGFGLTVNINTYIIRNCKFIWTAIAEIDGAGTSGWPVVSHSGGATPVIFENNEIICAPYSHPKANNPAAGNSWPASKFTNVRTKNNSFSVKVVPDAYFIGNQPYQTGSIIYNAGNYYVVAYYGLASAVGPTHTSGTVANGTTAFTYLPEVPVGAYFYSVFNNTICDQDKYTSNKISPSSSGYVIPLFTRSNTIQAYEFRLTDAVGTNTNNSITTGAAPPVSGTYAQGDIVFNYAAASGQPAGWMCVAGGSPGTWKAMANLA